MVKKVISQISLFINLWFVWLITGIILWIIFPKGVLELNWNERHNLVFDNFFSIITYLGSGFVFGFFVFVLIFINRRKFFIALSTSLVCLLTSIIMKQFFFKGEMRPISFFGDSVNIHLPDGAEKLLFGSFPSGHTLSAFAMFLLIAFFIKNNFLQVILFITAALVGTSRIYLMAHFKEDVWTGSLLGVAISIGVIYFFQNYFNHISSYPLISLNRNGKKI